MGKSELGFGFFNFAIRLFSFVIHAAHLYAQGFDFILQLFDFQFIIQYFFIHILYLPQVVADFQIFLLFGSDVKLFPFFWNNGFVVISRFEQFFFRQAHRHSRSVSGFEGSGFIDIHFSDIR